MSLVLLLLVFSATFLPIRADDYIDWSVGKICGFIFGGVFVAVAIIACLACYRAWIRSKRDKMFLNFKDPTPCTQILGHPLPPSPPPPPPPQSESTLIYNPEYAPTLNAPDPFFVTQNAPSPLGINQISYYPPFSSYIQENPMIISQPYSCQAERTNTVMASAPLASLESIPHEDLSDSSVYRRFFSPETDITPTKSADPPIGTLSSPPHTSPSHSKPRTYKLSLALRDAARMFRFSSMSGPIGRQEDAITLEDGTTISSSLPQPSDSGGSQTRLFKQQKNLKKNGAAKGGMSSGSRIGRKSKNSTASQDTGHCNSFEIAEIEEMESSVDNDRFLHSLESAVFTPSVNSNGGCNNAVLSHYSSASTLDDGDLAEFGGHSAAGSIHLPLPPGSPVIGFAYLGLGDVQEEDDFVQRIEEKGSREAIDPNGSASTVGTDLARAGTPPVGDEIRLLNRNKITGQHEIDHNHCNSSDSATSATAMLPTSRGLGQSISASYMDLRPLSTNMETWLVASDEHLLISPTGESASRSQKSAAHPMRSVSSNDVYMKSSEFTSR